VTLIVQQPIDMLAMSKADKNFYETFQQFVRDSEKSAAVYFKTW